MLNQGRWDKRMRYLSHPVNSLLQLGAITRVPEKNGVIWFQVVC